MFGKLCSIMILAAIAATSCRKEPSPEQKPFDPISLPSEEEQENGLPSGWYAQGHVYYDDGAPAEGVAVSDGENVSVTDINGFYSVATSSDTWYIYFSHPSDAAIEKDDAGRPLFFRKYVRGKHVYDFRLKRIPAEDEFTIITLADPQAHYEKRYPQKLPDTDRFRDETVPSLNARIADIGSPCYCITLGDIVYSEGSRNSNPGFVTMRSHFADIAAPVFQTMGNHDYNFFNSSHQLKTNGKSSTLYLAQQRLFEDYFGPINHSFNRGKVHFVCMRNINYDSETNAGAYHAGFTDAQVRWIKADLAAVPQDYCVVLCVHIPLAQMYEDDNVYEVLELLESHPNPTVFSGHAHYHRGIPGVLESQVNEYVHSAVCGQWWWSRICGDGCPAGFCFYRFKGNGIKDSRFTGYNDGMDSPSYQMRVYAGGLTYGGKHALFKHWSTRNQLLVNVFNGDETWDVTVYENGEPHPAFLMDSRQTSWSSVSAGATYEVPSSSNQDWWAIGYHVGVCGLGTDNTSFYTKMYHMWRYSIKNPGAELRVEATDPYGNTYSCSSDAFITGGTSYPDYIRTPLAL